MKMEKNKMEVDSILIQMIRVFKVMIAICQLQ